MKSSHDDPPVSLLQIRGAQIRIRRYVHHTPVVTSETFDRLTGATVHFKLENFQKIGAFKARGAHNAVFAIPSNLAVRGVVTHSSGNHAAALALAARNRRIKAYVVMPSNAPKPKVASVERLGGQITFCEPTLAARESTCEQLQAKTGATLIHPYDDRRIIAGQGTVALELLQDIPSLNALLAPVGGGGLLSGTAVAAQFRKGVKVYGAEPAEADDAARSFRAGKLIPLAATTTIADGLRTSLSPLTFSLIRENVEDIATVSEESILRAMRLVWEILKIVIEPSAAVPVAALLDGKLKVRRKRIGVILSGGNIDLDRLPWTLPQK